MGKILIKLKSRNILKKKGGYMHRRDDYLERYKEFTTERGWTTEEQEHIGRIAMHGCGSSENLEHLVREIYTIEDRIAEEQGEAVIAYDNVFNRAGIIRRQRAE